MTPSKPDQLGPASSEGAIATPPSSSPQSLQSPEQAPEQLSLVQRWIYSIGAGAAAYLLVAAVDALSITFQSVLGPQAEALMTLAANPVLGLVLGILVTALVQSSSAVTALLVALVAGGVPVAIAIPAILGANLGTTVTNTLVSLGYVGEDEGFERGFAAATLHDFFNLTGLLLVFPLELTLHPLARASEWLAGQLPEGLGAVPLPPVAVVLWPTRWLLRAGASVPAPWDTLVCLSVSLGALMLGVSGLSGLLRRLFHGAATRTVDSALNQGPLWSLIAGTGLTTLVQSSSVTTSLTVPLASAGLVSLETVYPFVVGANLGTCATALLAAATVGGSFKTLALQAALVHLGFNGLIALVVYGIPPLRQYPLRAARWLAKVATTYRLVAIAYVLGAFFVLPSGVLLLGLWLRGQG